MEDLFGRIGPVSKLSLRYDRAGRSEGVAFVTYNRVSDARTAIAEFDGANAKGQPVRLTLLCSSNGKLERTAQMSKGSLFDRIALPRGRNRRSLSPDDNESADRRRRHGRHRANICRSRRSDVSKPPPDYIDRYVPGQGSPIRRNGSERRGDRNRGDSSRRNPNHRPRKTQEELDQEMEDYWETVNTGDAGATGEAPTLAAPAEAVPETATVPSESQPVEAPPSVAAPVANGDDDVDMIE